MEETPTSLRDDVAPPGLTQPLHARANEGHTEATGFSSTKPPPPSDEMNPGKVRIKAEIGNKFSMDALVGQLRTVTHEKVSGHLGGIRDRLDLVSREVAVCSH
eukprot:1623029-Amphidinium_carterae.1